MEERLSILEEEKLIECPLCNYLVSSFNPICQKCGLEMSSEGITELAKSDDSSQESTYGYKIEFADIHNLRLFAILSLVYIAFGYLFYLMLEIAIFFKIYYWMGLLIYFSMYTSWNKKFSKEVLLPEDTELVKKEKTISLLIFLSSTILGSIIYIFLLK